MRDYCLIWNKRTQRYDIFDLRDCKRQRDKLGEVSSREVWLDKAALDKALAVFGDVSYKKAPPKRG